MAPQSSEVRFSSVALSIVHLVSIPFHQSWTEKKDILMASSYGPAAAARNMLGECVAKLAIPGRKGRCDSIKKKTLVLSRPFGRENAQFFV